MLTYLVFLIMFNSWYKHGMGKKRFKNLELSLWITLTYVNTIEYVYFASSYYIYIFIHAKMIHQQPLSFHYY